ncbi:MAG TPA: hypothetical protein VE824_00425 [Gaiellales bacterium]|nr:hypothetical protein [Gaiellales bacterium]
MSAGRFLDEALAEEAAGYRAELEGRPAADHYRAARDAYLASHAETGPQSWGRLIGALKMAILARGDVEPVARRALAETASADSPAAAYARALAAVALGETPEVEPMLEAGGAFRPAGEALAALAAGDAGRYRAAVDAIVADFAARDEHLSGVAVADTAMVLERLAEPRGMAVRPASPLIP